MCFTHHSPKAVPNTLVKDTVVKTLVLAGLRKKRLQHFVLDFLLTRGHELHRRYIPFKMIDEPLKSFILYLDTDSCTTYYYKLTGRCLSQSSELTPIFS